MKLSKRVAFFLVFWISSSSSWAQAVMPGYFRSPVKPGGRNYLSGNFSELRPNHFHTGLDFKIGGREGEPIYAAADGWVHRIKVSTFGYGNVIYLKHPSGHITVYGHLRNFNKTLHRYVLEGMYQEEKNDFERYPEQGILPVKKGELIGYGGNTGSSGGPHLHFEIRDSLDRAMDPLLFGFPEIVDRLPPTPQILAFTPLDIQSRIDGQFERKELPLVPTNGGYTIPKPIAISGKVGLEIKGFDQADGVGNRNGFPTFELWQGDSLYFSLIVDKVDFTISRQFLLHTHQNRFSKLYFQPDLRFDFISPKTATTGHLELPTDTQQAFTLKLRDAYKNEQTIKFTLKGTDLRSAAQLPTPPSEPKVEYLDNILKVTSSVSDMGGLAEIQVGHRIFEMLPDYQDDRTRVYLWDMRFGIPEKIDLCDTVIFPKATTRIAKGIEKLYAEKSVQLRFFKETLLKDLYLQVHQEDGVNPPRLHINDPDTFLFSAMEVRWSPPQGNWDPEKTQVYLVDSRGRKNHVGGTWEDGAIRFETRNLGTFTLAEDTTGPTITPIRIHRDGIRFTIRDDLSGIARFEAKVNGKWILMHYEHKKSLIWSETLENQALQGPVVLRIWDRTGNRSEWTGTIS